MLMLAERWIARYHGWLDGRKLIPDEISQVPPPHMTLLQRIGQARVGRAEERWLRRDGKVHALCVGRALGLEQALAAETAAGEAAHLARTRLEAKRQEAERLDREINPPGAWYCPRGAYRLAVVLLSLGDLPLTFLAFQTFGLTPLYTAVLSGMVVAMLTALGHFTGHYARHLRWGQSTLMAAVLTLAAGFIGSLTFLRETAIQAVTTGDGSVDPVAGTLVFAFVTAIGFVVPALLAFHVRAEPEAAVIRRAARECRRDGRAHARAARGRLRAERRLRRAMARRTTAHAEARRTIAGIATETARQMAEYAEANQRSREGGGTPPGLQPAAMPALEMPGGLRELAWDPLVQQVIRRDAIGRRELECDP